MATSRPTGAHPKERSSSASSVTRHMDTLHRQRTTSPSVSGSTVQDLHRKPAVSKSTTGMSKARSQHPSNVTAGRRVLTRNPTEKPSSLSGPPRRVPTPNTLKGKTVEASSSSPRAAISSKPALNKPSKPLKSRRTQPLVRAKSLGADTRKVTGSPAHSTTEVPRAIFKSEQEEKPEIQVEEIEPVDIPAVKDDDPDELDLTDSSEPKFTEDTTDFASQTHQHEPSFPEAEIEIATTNDGEVRGDGERADEDRESPKEPEEKPAIENSKEPKSEPVVDGGMPEEGAVEKATAVESSETKRPEVVAFTRPEVAATGRKKDAPRSNDVIEEARGKLMEKRKSKVLALVGAFETVISLREPEGQTQEKIGDGGA